MRKAGMAKTWPGYSLTFHIHLNSSQFFTNVSLLTLTHTKIKTCLHCTSDHIKRKYSPFTKRQNTKLLTIPCSEAASPLKILKKKTLQVMFLLLL